MFPVKFTVKLFGFSFKITVTERDFERVLTEAFGVETAAKVMALLRGLAG